jgi:hypothetical protein
MIIFKHTFFKIILAVSFVFGTVFSAFAQLTNVPSPNSKVPGFAVPNILSPELIEAIVAQGSMQLENLSALTGFYGYDNDEPMLPAPGAIQSPGNNVEAT